eukprot:scaffold7446_cov403-Prasinococcus_capsulatus_cf.AAC.13
MVQTAAHCATTAMRPTSRRMRPGAAPSLPALGHTAEPRMASARERGQRPPYLSTRQPPRRGLGCGARR